MWCGTVHDLGSRDSDPESDRHRAKALAAARDANDRPIDPGYGA